MHVQEWTDKYVMTATLNGSFLFIYNLDSIDKHKTYTIFYYVSTRDQLKVLLFFIFDDANKKYR